MSTKKLEWLFGLEDKMSGPASVAGKKLELLERRIKSVAKAEAEMSGPKKERLTFARLNLEIQRDQLRGSAKHEEEGFHSRSMDKVKGLLEGTKKLTAGAFTWVGAIDHGLGIVEKIGSAAIAIGQAFVHAAESVGRLVYRFGELAIEAASAKENTILTFKALVGSESAAEAMVESLERLSYVSPFSSDQQVGLGRKLLAGGFGAEQVPTLLRAIGDAAAATGAGFAKADEAVDAIRRIRAEGALSTKTLRALHEAGVPTGAVYERLGEVFGVTAKQARELVKAGKVDSANGLFAIVGAVKDVRSGGALGTAAERYATETISGLRKSIADKKEELFGDIFKASGFGSFKGFLKNINEALDPENPIGKRIRGRVTDTFNRIFTSLFGPLTGDQGLERVEKVVNKVLLAIDALVGAGRVLWNVFEGFYSGVFRALGIDVDNLLGAGGALDPAGIDAIVRAAHNLSEQFGYIATKVQLAMDWVFGFSRAIDQAMSLVEPFAKLASFGGRLVGLGGEDEPDDLQLRTYKAWKLYQARTGEQIPLGEFMRGFASGQIRFPAPQPAARAQDLAKGARTRVFSPKVENHINVQGGGGVDPDAIGEAAGDATMDSLSTWEDASMAMGATDG